MYTDRFARVQKWCWTRACDMYCLSKKEFSTIICLRSRGPLKGFKLIKRVTRTHLESMWNHSETSEICFFVADFKNSSTYASSIPAFAICSQPQVGEIGSTCPITSLKWIAVPPVLLTMNCLGWELSKPCNLYPWEK